MSLCQKNKIQLKEGVYSGGICMDGGICGYWLIKSDNTFLFVNFVGNNIKQLGVGTCQLINDSLTKFIFKNNHVPILGNSKIAYFSETSGSFDSVYLSGQLKNKKGEGIGYASILFDKKYQVVSDENGYFKAIFPRKSQIATVTIIKKDVGYLPVEFDLSKHNNFHNLNIELSLADSSSCTAVYTSNSLLSLVDSLTIKTDKTNNKKRRPLNIVFLTNDKNFIISKLLIAKESQPHLRYNINSFIELIQK